jgi:phosphocarrier protein HPr
MVDLATTFFRVDPRLIHATVMNAWVPELMATHVVIADAEVQEDARRRHILEMSTLEEVELSFTSEQELGQHLRALEASGNVLVLFTHVDAVARAVERGAEIDELNVGHLPAISGASPMHPAVHLGPEDLKRLQLLNAEGVRVYVQPLPHDSALSPIGIPRPVPVRRPRRRSSVASAASPGFATAEVEVVNERGLHLRAANVLAHFVSSYTGEVRVGRPGHLVNAKSLLGLTTLGAARGAQLVVEVEGPEQDEFLEKVRQLFAGGFDEGSAA